MKEPGEGGVVCLLLSHYLGYTRTSTRMRHLSLTIYIHEQSQPEGFDSVPLRTRMLYVCTTVSEYGLSREVDQILGVQLPLYMSQTPRYGCTPLRLDCVSLFLSFSPCP